MSGETYVAECLCGARLESPTLVFPACAQCGLQVRAEWGEKKK